MRLSAPKTKSAVKEEERRRTGQGKDRRRMSPPSLPLRRSPISSCHPSNEYQLNCSVDLRSLDVNVICVSVADGGAQTNERRA